MRKTVVGIAAAAAIAFTTAAHAELQNVTIDGSIQIRGNYYRNLVADPGPEVRWPGFFLPKRAIGVGAGNFPGIVSRYKFDSKGADMDYVEQRTRVGVRADFTNQVSSYIELDNYHIWGDDFRSNHVTGTDFRPGGNPEVPSTNVNLYQAYVQAEEMWDVPLRLRVGRQEMEFGSGWLVGTNSSAPHFTGLSFDGVRATYAADEFSVDVFASQLAENSPVIQDDNVTFAGIYGSYTGQPDMTFDAYWLWLRDPRTVQDTNFVFLLNNIENFFGLDRYDTHNLHTFGLRGAGTFEGLDYEAEVAYQTGDAPQVGQLFRPFIYGDDGADYDHWGMHAEVGYTFDTPQNPRVFLGGAWFEGEDNRSLNFLEWLNPFHTPRASVSFNRLFSDYQYSRFIGDRALSNVWLVRGGGSIEPTEETKVELVVSYFRTDEAFSSPAHFRFGRFRVPFAPGLSFWDSSNSRNLGWEAELSGTYNYTEDLQFRAGWAHFFTGSGAEEGQFVADNGLGFVGGRNDRDADYVFVETKLSF